MRPGASRAPGLTLGVDLPKANEAYTLLASILDWFGEGAADPDLVAARELLAAFGPS